MITIVTPCMGVWIETSFRFCGYSLFVSHPVWVCGLKLAVLYRCSVSLLSHPVWVCGLKLRNRSEVIDGESHTLYGCVD